jgi:hypothetical protein
MDLKTMKDALSDLKEVLGFIGIRPTSDDGSRVIEAMSPEALEAVAPVLKAMKSPQPHPAPPRGYARQLNEMVPTMDAPARTAKAAAEYAAACDREGARQGRRACRTPRASVEQVNWPTMTMDSDAVSEAASRINGYDDCKSYAEQCRRLHRK